MVTVEPPVGPDWPNLHADIQAALSGLDDSVSREVPSVQIAANISAGGNLLFMSCREFRRLDHLDSEAVLASVECWKLDEKSWRISSDVAGEESGTVHFRGPEFTVAAIDGTAVEHAAREAAQILSGTSLELIASLINLDDRSDDDLSLTPAQMADLEKRIAEDDQSPSEGRSWEEIKAELLRRVRVERQR